MKIHILSDLHNEFKEFEVQQTRADIVVLCGDIDVGVRGARWALDAFGGIPVLYICGNHEYYGKKIPKINAQLREISDSSDNFFFLENAFLELNGIRFVGCTLWTDFLLFGRDHLGICCNSAEQVMTDFSRIRLGAKESFRKLRAADVIKMHKESIRFLEKTLSQDFKGKTVVLSHHAPLSNSIPGKYQNDWVSAAFASNLEALITKYQPEFWFHGHTHFNVNYRFGQTTIISNQRGYYPTELTPGFDENLMIEIS